MLSTAKHLAKHRIGRCECGNIRQTEIRLSLRTAIPDCAMQPGIFIFQLFRSRSTAIFLVNGFLQCPREGVAAVLQRQCRMPAESCRVLRRPRRRCRTARCSSAACSYATPDALRRRVRAALRPVRADTSTDRTRTRRHALRRIICLQRRSIEIRGCIRCGRSATACSPRLPPARGNNL